MGHQQQILVAVNNTSDKTIRITEGSLKHGKFHRVGHPREKIDPRVDIPPKTTVFRDVFESCGRLQFGTEGYVKFGVEGKLVCLLSWACPVLKPKWCTADASDGWIVTHNGGDFTHLQHNIGRVTLTFSQKLVEQVDGASLIANQLQQSRDQLNELRELENCIVCMTKKRNVMFRPCGHVPYCEDCLALHTMTSCPLCRQPIASTISPVYF